MVWDDKDGVIDGGRWWLMLMKKQHEGEKDINGGVHGV